MPIGITPEHEEFARSVAGFAARHAPMESTRTALDALGAGARPDCWAALVAQGLTAVHLPERYGGAGAGVQELAVTLEESGRALLPGPFLPAVLTSAVLARYAGADAAALLRQLAEGAVAATALSAGLTAQETGDGWEISGEVCPVPGAAGARFLLLGARTGTPGGEVWFVAGPGDGDTVTAEAVGGVDPTRDVARVRVRGLRITAARTLAGIDGGRVRRVAAVLCSAEAVGVARWCFDTALAYVKVREQFDRPVGSFQAVKHKAANLYTRLQVATAAAWDAARAADDTGADAEEQLTLAAAGAGAICLPLARETALECLTMLGGIGFTWEHDIHLYWRRGIFLAQILGEPGSWAGDLGRRILTTPGTTRRFDLELSADAEDFRAWAGPIVDEAARLPGERRRMAFLAGHGLVSPHYPKPYGIAATAVQQVVLEQEFARAGISRPTTVLGESALPAVITHGTQYQKDLLVEASLRGDIVWCQMFSEPGAGSDLLSLRTRADKVDGGWRLNGQKIWTSKAHEAHYGFCLARTDPDARRHHGLTVFLVDMRASGLDVRPLRQAHGAYGFNEVFLDDVFVPDDMVVGQVHHGWKVALTGLGGERSVMGAGAFAAGLADLLADIGSGAPADVRAGSRSGVRSDIPSGAPADVRSDVRSGAPSDVRSDVRSGVPYGSAPAVRPGVPASRIGRLAAEEWALRAVGTRITLRQIAGTADTAAASILKYARTEHQRAIATTRLELLGPAGATSDGAAAVPVIAYLGIPAALLGGGTREIQLNVISERILGLPRG